MVTYVNTVFVSNNETASLLTKAQFEAITAATAAQNKGRFVVYDVDAADYAITANTTRFKIGMVTGSVSYDHKGVGHANVKWSNIIQTADVKSMSKLAYADDTEDTIEIDFTNMSQEVIDVLDKGNKRVIVRLTFKDLPTRYRKWTESYEYVTKFGDTAETITSGIAELINKQWKRARVIATANGTKLTLEAMKYDDDNSVDSINWYEKVRFNANIYYTDPAADGWEALNKHYPTGVVITKTPGSTYPASAKLVRDREAQGMGYEGILNRGDGTWPIIKPAMETKLDGQYNALTLEFENLYHAADDISRKTKQSIEIYSVAAGLITAIANAVNTALGKNDRAKFDNTTEHSEF